MSFNEETFQEKLKQRADAPPPRLIHYLLRNEEVIKGCISNGMTAHELKEMLVACGWNLSYNSVLKNLQQFKVRVGIEDVTGSRKTPIRHKRTAAQQRSAVSKSKLEELKKPSLAQLNKEEDL